MTTPTVAPMTALHSHAPGPPASTVLSGLIYDACETAARIMQDAGDYGVPTPEAYGYGEREAPKIADDLYRWTEGLRLLADLAAEAAVISESELCDRAEEFRWAFIRRKLSPRKEQYYRALHRAGPGPRPAADPQRVT